MLLSKIGEFGLIQRFGKAIKTDSDVIVASGDDCAVLKLNKKDYQLFTCDMLVQDVDFTLKDDPYLIGRKAQAVSISDIAACAGIPRFSLVALAIPKNISLEFIDRLFKGILDLAKEYKINIVGGDLSRSQKLTIEVSLLGMVEKKNLALRSGAKKGDIIFVTGELGGSRRRKHLNFIPRLWEARFLAKNFKLNAMIDISDGLAQDLGHILKASNTGAMLYEDLIPLSKEARNLADALYSGEDFELLFSLSRPQAKRLLKLKLNNFKAIGEMVDKRLGLRIVNKRNQEKIIKPKGYQHF